ncbi:Mam33 mitochondrial acidic matrix protein [Candida orthopsilosis Co 90-125]|uniref:Mam33 mitochondrial acidic matrix protein n=1 Tax=Candida orthopsilosis (strain 90-125) TaxID=1136231 RepID=H8XAU0_CANO9|nr:Mam33 mitochondrial acidic matrix protein [Candida orthopsilosis Co 90-125]CCG24941.1 Mam33 mitochondrial acidic matrix protein [Candida orthopsilosis Co 90-125]
MLKSLPSSLRSVAAKRIATQSSRLRSGTMLKSCPKAITTITTRSFHQTSIMFNQTPESALNEVVKAESKISEAIPNELDQVYQEFLNTSGFEVVSTPGTASVELVKKDADTGNILHVYFDIDEVTDIPTEDLAALESGDLEEEANQLDQLLCNVKILVENPSNNSGLFLNLFLQNTESSFMIDFVNVQEDVRSFIKSIKEENEFIDKFKYQGPKFAELDESLQTEFENYLVAKGIDNELADFIVAFSDYKEEGEYRTWLNAVSKFLN